MLTKTWNDCDITFLSPNITNLTSYHSNIHRLESTCSTLLFTRLFFYGAFLLLSSCLLFSFVRHHTKYDRTRVLCTGIETERHRVVIALFIGTFARSLSFIIHESYMFDNQNISKIIHLVLRVIKDICYVQSFSLVVVFWLTLLQSVDGTQSKWNVHRLQMVAVVTFGVCRLSIAIIRPIIQANQQSIDENERLTSKTNIDLILYGILSSSYFIFFVVGLIHGCRLNKRLAKVGKMVKKNMYRLRIFMAIECFFCVVLASSTLLRMVLFANMKYTRYENPTLYYYVRTTVKGSELGLTTTLTLLMIARTRSRTRTRESEAAALASKVASSRERNQERNQNGYQRESDLSTNTDGTTITTEDEYADCVSDDWQGRKTSGEDYQHDDALFDRRSFSSSRSLGLHSMQDSFGSSNLSQMTDLDVEMRSGSPNRSVSSPQ